MSESIEKLLETISVGDNDIILMKGDWTQEEMLRFSQLAQDRQMNNILVVVPDSKALENMPTEDFFYLLKEVQKRRKVDEGSLDFFAETGLLPLRIKLEKDLHEVIICDDIDSDYENGMPETVTLARKMKNGNEYHMRYVQDSEFFDEE